MVRVLLIQQLFNLSDEDRLTKQGWRMYIQGNGTKDKPLSETQQRRNDRIAKIRSRVEHVFAGLAQLGGKTVRSIGLPRATSQLNWKVAAYNLQRLVYLKEAGLRRSDAQDPFGPPKLRAVG
jgi:IS5 family transposase